MHIDNRYAALCDQLGEPRFFHRQRPEPLTAPQAVHFNQPLAERLNWSWTQPAEWVPILSGETVPTGFDPLAMAYAGHQFGYWAGQLGDGRGLLLAQLRDQQNKLQDLHLKGAGRTPYSRGGDGRAVLRSSIREYLAGQALFHLGVPTSQALGIVSSTTPVQRETLEQGAMVLRVSDCHVRLGHFEWISAFAPQLLAPFTEAMQQLYFPETCQAEQPVLAFAEAVMLAQVRLVARWQVVGFAHGVLNTDNLNITGSTLDFGPYGFIERFNPEWINNHSDENGRYTYGRQPSVVQWNVAVWMGNLMALGVAAADLRALISRYESELTAAYLAGMAPRFGLVAPEQADLTWIGAYLDLLQQAQLDYHNSFRLLTDDPDRWLAQFENSALRAQAADWLKTWQARIQGTEAQAVDLMARHNPYYVLRNHMAQTAIEQAERGNYDEVARLFDLLAQPFTWQPERHRPADLAPLAADAPACAVSCSS